MYNSLIKFVGVSLIAVGLVSCSSFNSVSGRSPNGAVPDGDMASNETVGGRAEHSMDAIDKNKLSHALDSALGKATSWQNASTGVNYTVVPVRKTTVGSNSLCREYKITKSYGSNSQEISGVACVGTDGMWHPA
jgi:surface antigen